jgi:recombination protein RecA
MRKPERAEPAKDRTKALDAALVTIRRQYGEGAVMRLGQHPPTMDVEVIPTGVLSLDIALGVGGLPRGRVVEMFGSEGSGKTTMSVQMLASCQRFGGTVAFIDAEHALPREYAEALGVNVEELLVSQPDTGEQALEIVDALVRSGAVDMIVVDSVAALVPQAELEGDMGDSHVGLQARLMSQALRKISGSVSNTHCIVIFINQIREKIGVMFGPTETTPGGRALKFWSSIRIEIKRGEWIKHGTDIVGVHSNARIVKNKVAPPFRRAEFDIIYGKGISREGCIIDEGVRLEIVEKAGSWYAYGDTRLGQGRDGAVAFLVENPAVAEEIEQKILVAAEIGTPAEAAAVEEEEAAADGE